ncbi:hypothetical protein MMC30_007686 [Trapelia coarctata]|nr:hypothetical protein [Trapelia coarctata]
MVSIKDVRLSNSSLKVGPPGMVALFVGATSGIGEATLKQFAKSSNAPKVYIVGRSKTSATSLLKELETLNPQGTFNFIQSEISLIRNVDAVCNEIKGKEKKMDLVFLSPGFLTFAGRQETVEGIDTLASLRIYARFRIIHNLLPLLVASTSPRVVTVLAAGREGTIDLNNLEPPSFTAAANTSATQTTLALEELTKSYPSISFCHAFPGFVNTGIMNRAMRSASGIWALPATILRWTVLPLAGLIWRKPEEAGERFVFVATSAKYPPTETKGDEVGISLPKGVGVAESSVMKNGERNGVYRLDENGESAANSAALAGYRQDKVDENIWKQIEAVWERALEKTV